MRLCAIWLLVAWSTAAEVRTVTAYCACKRCTPGTGLTASGKKPNPTRTVAANWTRFGTRLHIAGIGNRVVEDRMASRHQHRVDVYFERHRDAVKFGKKRLKVTVCK